MTEDFLRIWPLGAIFCTKSL